MALVRWDPFNTRSLWQWPSLLEEDEDVSQLTTSRNMDVYETENEVVVKANVAGVKPDKVDVTYNEGVLWIRAQQERRDDQEDKKYHHRTIKSYSYRVAVPGNIDLKSDPQAEVDNGIITVTFKKAEEAKPKKISVKSRSK